MLKIIDLSEAPSTPMDGGRGTKKRLVDKADAPGARCSHEHACARRPTGKLHKHSVADNVYIVRSGSGEFIVEGKTYRVKKARLSFIPAGLRHSLSNVSDEPFEISRFYAPAGDKSTSLSADEDAYLGASRFAWKPHRGCARQTMAPIGAYLIRR